MEDVFLPIIIVGILFIGMPWLIFHYVTKWKQAPKITEADERMLDEMHQLSRRLEERLHTVERIIAADNPDWRPGLAAPDRAEELRLEDDPDLRQAREQFAREFRQTQNIERSN